MQTPSQQNVFMCRRRSVQYSSLIVQQVGEKSMVGHILLVYLLKVPLEQPHQEIITRLQRCWAVKAVPLISEPLLWPGVMALPTLNIDRELKKITDVTAESSPQIFVIYAFPETRTLFFSLGQTHPVYNSNFASRSTSQDELSNFWSAVLQSLETQVYYL